MAECLRRAAPRASLILALVAWLTPPATADPEYRWTLSTSLTDPYANAGPEGGSFTLYLWFISPTSDGMTSAEFALSTPTQVTPLLFTAHNGFMNSGGLTELRLSVGLCPTGPVIAGSWLLPSAGGGEYCLVESSGGHLQTADCAGVPESFPIEVTCYRAGAPGRWTISRSGLSPSDTSGPLEFGVASLYLWYQAPPDEGMSSATFSLQSPPGALNLGFTEENGFSNAGSATDLLLSAGGCPSGPVVAGHWSVEHQNLGGQYCLVEDPSGDLLTMDCNTIPEALNVDYRCYEAVSVQSSGWTLSKNPFDPADTTGVQTGAPLPIYLWYQGPGGAGMSAAEFDLSVPAGMSNFGFTAMNGFLNAGGASNLLLAVGGCPQGPVVAGSWTLFGSTAGQICLVNSAAHGIRVTLDCDTVPGVLNVNYGCYHYGIVAVSTQSWSKLKSAFR